MALFDWFCSANDDDWRRDGCVGCGQGVFGSGLLVPLLMPTISVFDDCVQ